MDEVDKKSKEVVDSVNTTVSRNLEKLLETRGLSQRQFCQKMAEEKISVTWGDPKKLDFYCVTGFNICYAFFMQPRGWVCIGQDSTILVFL